MFSVNIGHIRSKRFFVLFGEKKTCSMCINTAIAWVISLRVKQNLLTAKK